jgi:exodeoxyribonuclease X
MGQVLNVLNALAIVAHNARVDVDVLRRKLGDWECPEVFDTLQLARRLMTGQQSYKLGALADAFKLAERLPGGLSPHRATYDALVAASLFVELATRAGSLAELRGQPAGGGDGEGTPALF